MSVRKKQPQVKNNVSKILILVGAAFILGSAGDSDTGRISLELILIKLILGVFLCFVGFLLHSITVVKETRTDGKER